VASGTAGEDKVSGSLHARAFDRRALAWRLARFAGVVLVVGLLIATRPGAGLAAFAFRPRAAGRTRWTRLARRGASLKAVWSACSSSTGRRSRSPPRPSWSTEPWNRWCRWPSGRSAWLGFDGRRDCSEPR